jgi:hypothetical protein
LSGKHRGLQQSNELNEKAVVQQCHNSDVKEINWWPAESHLVMQIFAFLLNILAPPPDAPLAANSVSELCLETCVNVFRRDALLAEKPNDSSLVILHPLNEHHKRTDFATIILNVLLM